MKMIVEAGSDLGCRAQESVFPEGPGLMMRLVDADSRLPRQPTTYQMFKWELHTDGTMTIEWERAWWER